MALTDHQLGERVIDLIIGASLFRVRDAVGEEDGDDDGHVIVWADNAASEIGQLVKAELFKNAKRELDVASESGDAKGE